MNDVEKIPLESWEGNRRFRYRLASVHKLHFGEVFLKAYPDFIEDLQDILGVTIATSCMLRDKGTRRGISSDAWEGEVNRRLIKAGWSREIMVKDGILYNNSGEAGERFDFGRFDAKHNLARFWSYCFGRRAVYQGAALWKRELRKSTRKVWKEIAPEISTLAKKLDAGQDLEIPRQQPTVLGEIQKGNWAMAQRDFFKLVGAQTEIDVDLYVYVVTEGLFESLLSSNIVSRDQVLARLPAYRQVVNVPTIIVGVDCEMLD